MRGNETSRYHFPVNIAPIGEESTKTVILTQFCTVGGFTDPEFLHARVDQ